MIKNVVRMVTTSLLIYILFFILENKDVEAATKLPDNHEIEQLNVKFVDGIEGEYGSYIIDVGNRKGTLLIRVDAPRKAWNIQWVNWSIEKRTSVPFYLHTELNKEKQPYIAPFSFLHESMYHFPSKGTPDKWASESGIKRIGLQKLSGHSYPPTYYVGMAVYLPEIYSRRKILFYR